MSENRRANLLALVILALLPTLLFADVLLGINSFYTGDLSDYHFPGKKVLRDIVLSGELPYWNPFLSGGQPLAANPAHEVFYPLTWLILLPRYDLGLHLLILVHFYIALFAMYALLRSMELSIPAALFGAISFGLGGVILSTINVLPYLFSMSWVPLVCLYARKYLIGRAPRDGVLASVFLGVQLLIGEPTTAIESGIVLGMYAIYRGVKDDGTLSAVARGVAAIGRISIGALLVAAVQVLPALDHFRDSIRSRGLDFFVVGYWSMPFARIAELVYPTLLGHTRLDGPYLYWGAGLYPAELRPFCVAIYCGLLVAVLLAGGILARVRGTGLIVAIGLTSWVLATGRHTPLLRILHDSGIASWLRYPEKFAFMGVFAAIVFAAATFERVLEGDAKVRKTTLWVTVAVTGVAFTAWLIALTPAYESLFRGVWSPGPISPIGPMLEASRRDWLFGALRGLLLVVLLRNFSNVRRAVWLSLMGAFVLLDLCTMIPNLTPRVPSSFYREPPAAARQFPKERKNFRVFNQNAWSTHTDDGRFYTRPDTYLYWANRNSLIPLMPTAYGLRSAMENDYDLTQLLPTADFMKSVVTLAVERPSQWGDIAGSMSNVWFVGVYRPPREAIELAHGDPREIQPVRFFERTHSPRYYFADRVVTIRDIPDFVQRLKTLPDPRQIACTYEPAFIPARGVVEPGGVRESNNEARIQVRTEGRAFLVMSVTPHKYWRIAIDGQETNAIVTNVGYQGVIVPAGRHVVTMEYRNPLIAAGGAISLASLLALVLIARRNTIPAQ